MTFVAAGLTCTDERVEIKASFQASKPIEFDSGTWGNNGVYAEFRDVGETKEAKDLQLPEESGIVPVEER